MIDPRRSRTRIRRVVLGGLLVALWLALAPAAGNAAAPWAHRPAVSEAPLLVPPSFQLPGTNGYTLDVIAEAPRQGTPGSVTLVASAKGLAATYRVPATVSETSIQADLGALGEISVTFHPSNQAADVQCRGHTVQFDSGQYEGKIDFHGEEGYTSVEATSAPGNVDYLRNEFCGGSVVVRSAQSRHPRGAELYLRNPGLGARLYVHKRRPGAAAIITGWTAEYTDGISIRRYASQWMPGSDFAYDPQLRTATIAPPAPFAGTARFDREEKAGRRWSGDLTVDLPGKAGVPVTGPTLRAYLVPSE